MNRWLARMTILLLAAQGACKPASKPTPLSPADEAAVRALDAAFAKTFNASDAAGLAAFYTADAVLLPPNMPLASGSDAITRVFSGMIAEATPQLTLTPTKIEGRQDLAYTVGTYRLTMTPKKKGVAASTDEGKYVVVSQRQADGSWKIIADIWNSSKPPASPPAPARAPAPAKKRAARHR